MDFGAYLERIRFNGSMAADAETLRNLQVAHLLAVPFENLSIHAAEPIVLEDEALFEKIVIRRRGGFCYELNGLFAALLRKLGFEVSMLSAGVARAEGGFTPDFDHMALLVKLDQLWLVDVGFGDSFREPLLLEDSGVQTQEGGAYRVKVSGDMWTMMERKGEDWKPRYRFTLRSYEYADFVPRCAFHQTSPDSHFRRGRVCSRATPGGRVTLSELKFVRSTFEDERHERTLSDEEEVAGVLAERFGISM